jgi:ABC-type bacteriocin/lantibiotic exporter with double-glycine peptidase domain
MLHLPDEIGWVWKWMRPLFHLHFISFVCMTIGSFLTILTPLVLRWVIDELIPKRQLPLLYCAAAFIFGILMVRTLLLSAGNCLTLRAAHTVGLRLRISLLQHFDKLSADYYDKVPVGEPIYAMQEPVEEVSVFASDLLASMLRLSLNASFALCAMAVLNPVLTLAVLPFIPGFLFIRYHFRKRLATDSDSVHGNRLIWAAFLAEHLSSLISIQLLARGSQQERRAFQLLARTVRSQQRLVRTGVSFSICTSLVVVLAISIVVGVGGRETTRAAMSTGTLVAFYSLATQLFDPLSSAAELYGRAQKAFASVRQLRRMFAVEPSVRESTQAVALPRRQSAIEFQGVVFGYGGQGPVLSVPSLRILSGEHVAIAGENGAGKSTLVKLIARLYDVSSGCISVGGADLRAIQLNSLRRAVCYLPANAALFAGTLASRTTCGGPFGRLISASS